MAPDDSPGLCEPRSASFHHVGAPRFDRRARPRDVRHDPIVGRPRLRGDVGHQVPATVACEPETRVGAQNRVDLFRVVTAIATARDRRGDELDADGRAIRRGRRRVQRPGVVAMHIAGHSPFPLYVTDAEVDPAAIDKEREILRAKAIEQGKKAEIVDKIVDGQIAKWKKDVCLVDQIWVRDPEGKKTIGTLVTDIVSKLGENIKIRRFARWELGEGLEKKKDDFAAEVAKQAGLA